jgi:hypothetical protein
VGITNLTRRLQYENVLPEGHIPCDAHPIVPLSLDTLLPVFRILILIQLAARIRIPLMGNVNPYPSIKNVGT